MNSNLYAMRSTRKRAGIILIAFILFLALLLINIFKIAIIGHEEYLNKAYDQITTTSMLRAERGRIYDRNMSLLATTKTTWRVFISSRDIKRATSKSGIDYAKIISDGLSDILSLDKDTLYNKLKTANVLDITIKKGVPEDEYKKALDFVKQNSLGSLVFFEAESGRSYPNGTLLAHVLGFTGSDNQGLYGLEYYYESVLRGKDGYYLYAKDAGGNALPDSYATYVEPQNGNSLVTTIDSYIQEVLEGIIEEARINHNVSDRVCGIVMDTKSGAILGMATTSPFDPNSPYELDEVYQSKLDLSGLSEGDAEYKKLKLEYLQEMWSNKCLTETYEPGSTFKIITVASALDSGAVKTTDHFSCNGYHTVGGWRIKCHKTTGHGSNFSLAYGLQMSCNPTMMKIAERMGSEAFYSYVDSFGYLSKSGIDLPGEATTIFHNKENIGSTELATASFGQRFKVTIINHLTAIATVANRGKTVTPYIVEKIIDPYGNTVSEHQFKEGTQVISESVAREVSKILEEGVSGEGGAKNAYVDGYKIAAKTGTSQKFDKLDENGNSYLRIGSTVAYAPSDDSGIAVIIVVDEPQTTVKYGSTVAAPYVSKLYDAILPYLEYQRNVESNIYEVENYTGMSVDEAKELLEGKGVKLEIIGKGDRVLSQTPSPRVEITKELSTVRLYTEETDERLITVPSLLGMSLGDASRILHSLGISITLDGVVDGKANCLNVVSQSVPPGAQINYSDVITLTVRRTDFED